MCQPEHPSVQNVTAFAIGIQNQCDVSAAVRIVLKTFYNARNSIFIALEVNKTIVLLVTAALVTNRDTTVIVAAAIARLLFKKRCVRLALMQVRRLDCDDETASRRCRFGFMQ